MSIFLRRCYLGEAPIFAWIAAAFPAPMTPLADLPPISERTNAMSHLAGSDYSGSRGSSDGNRRSPLGEYFGDFVAIVRNHGLKGLAVLFLAALFAFAPLGVLYWFCEFRFASTLASQFQGRPVVIRPAQTSEEQERQEAGETALLQVICETTSRGETRPLLTDADPRRSQDFLHSSQFVNRERVYIRRIDLLPDEAAAVVSVTAQNFKVPFALVGSPPVSVWLPAGEYEILVVHEAPAGEESTDPRRRSFPFVSVTAECSLENKQKTVLRVPLPHYEFGTVFEPPASDARQQPDELAPLLAAWEHATAVPTPNGYLLELPEPAIEHTAEHRGCTIHFGQLAAEPREWTREQLATVRNWLPAEASVVNVKLSRLVDNLGWREFLAGWYCYAIAGITGLVFTRWGALAILEPWRRGESFFDNLGLLCKIFCAAIAVWFLVLVLTDSSSCSGPIRFRPR